MSKKYESTERFLKPDPRYGSKLIAKFVNSLMKQGKKSTARRVCYDALEAVAKKVPETKPEDIFSQAINNLKPVVEVRSKRVGGATYQVPMEVTSDRQASLALRWIVDFADGRKGIPMMKALAAEIMEAYQGQGNAIRKRDEVHKMAQANKAFAHFRW